MSNPIIWQILLQIMLIALNAVFACAEIAIISMNDNKLRQMASQGDKRAIRLENLTSQPAKFLATIQVAITLSGFLGSAFAADNFSSILVDWLVSIGVTISVSTLKTISVILITLILSYFTLVFGELVPKRLAMKKAEQLALFMSGLVSFIAKLFAPIVWTLTASTNLLLRLFGIDPDSEDDEVSEEEIRMMVDIGSQKGVIDKEEKKMIQNVFEFDDLSVREFGTHRIDISLLWMDESLEEWEKTIQGSKHSKYPICDGSIDTVIGILYVMDYYMIKEKTLENIMKNAVKPVYFIPENIRADVLLKQMKQCRNHFAVMIDEYGGMIGVVTMNDLLEQLVGDLDDGNSIEETLEEIEQIDEKTWKIDGGALLREVADKLPVPLSGEDYDTFGGYLLGAYGSIPDDGSCFEMDLCSLHIEVTDVKGHRIRTAIVSIIEKNL